VLDFHEFLMIDFSTILCENRHKELTKKLELRNLNHRMYVAVLFGCNKVEPKIIACSKSREKILKFCEVTEDDVIPNNQKNVNSWVYRQFPEDTIDKEIVCYHAMMSNLNEITAGSACSCFYGLAIIDIELSAKEDEVYDLDLSRWFVNPNAVFAARD